MALLENSLNSYLEHPSSNPFTFQLVDEENVYDYTNYLNTLQSSNPKASLSLTSKHSESSPNKQKSSEPEVKNSKNQYLELINSINEFKKLGNILSSSTPQALTESESEYVVSCVKHFFPNHILFHFICKNTIEEQQLENVSVRLELDDQLSESLSFYASVQGEFSILTFLSFYLLYFIKIIAKKLRYGSTCHVFACYERDEMAFPVGSLTCTLKFLMKEVNESTGEPEEDDEGVEDEFQLDDVDLSVNNYICKSSINSDWNDVWEQLGEGAQKRIVFSLPKMDSLSSAINEIIQYLSLQPCNQSNKVPPKKTKHVLYLAGSFLGLFPIVVRARMKLDNNQANVEIVCRSSSEEISQMIISII